MENEEYETGAEIFNEHRSISHTQKEDFRNSSMNSEVQYTITKGSRIIKERPATSHGIY